VSVPAARFLSFTALCAFAALQWMNMLDPAAHERAWYALLAASFAVAGLLAAGRLRAPLRNVAAGLVAVAAFALALLGGGVADELLRVDRWGELAAGIGRGISALPGARVPYRGLDEWTRTVLQLGGTMLAVLAALAAFWPRQAELGFRHVALVLLMTLYAVPAVALDMTAQFVSGAALFMLVVAYLRLERLQVGDAGAAGLLALAVTILGMMAAPALDTSTPWFDYETWALSNASSKSTSFSWEHTYGPLDWPRDGRELLRVRARQPAYWKAMNLDRFDGRHWVRDTSAPNLDGCDLGAYDPGTRDRWLQRISVSVRNLRTPTFITAGVTCAIDAPRIARLPLGDGTYATATRALRRGDAYGAFVYTPSPTERQLRAAGGFMPQFLERYTRIELPGPGPEPLSGEERRGQDVQFPLWDTPGPPLARPSGDPAFDPQPARRLVVRGAYGRAYLLAQNLKRGSRTEQDFVERVQRYLGRGFAYTETPPPPARNLEGFLFDAKLGYCQQFSGAMALLLRMGGVPARVSTGFTSGSYDRKAHEYVVRDLDAHSWVEAWYPSIGWVTFDPTPAEAPARSQPDEEMPGSTAVTARAPDLGGDVRTNRGRLSAVSDQGTSTATYVLLAAAVLAALALAVWLVRRRRRLLADGWGPLPELERALRRARRAPGPATTLQALERTFRRSPAAAGYVRALRDQRYGMRTAPPPAGGRRAVRAELGRGAGLLGHLRAWWALPPKAR
jgi:transglutaminase-like putative cysteine protease